MLAEGVGSRRGQILSKILAKRQPLTTDQERLNIPFNSLVWSLKGGSAMHQHRFCHFLFA